ITALQTPERAPSPEAARALASLTIATDSLAAPQLFTVDGRPVGDVKLETPADVERVRAEIQLGGGTSDSGRIGRLFQSRGRALFWVTVPVRRQGQVIGFIAQERRLGGSNPRSLQPFKDLVGPDIDLYLHNAED